MRVTPILRIYNLHPYEPKQPKFRAFPSIRSGHPEEFTVVDTITRERIPCESEAELWEKFNEVNGRGILV